MNSLVPYRAPAGPRAIFLPLAKRLPPPPHLTLALDRSMRSYSVDGHLRVRDAPISKAEVSEYFGRELAANLPPGVHLDPDKQYGVLRPASELAKAAPSFCALPLLWTHKPLDSEHHPSDITCGATGTDVRFEHPWLRGSLVVWVHDVIDAINAGINSLSAGYHFDAIPEDGGFDGKRYQFRMSGIIGNHVAIVDQPRVVGAQIGDGLPLALRRQPALLALGKRQPQLSWRRR